MADGARYSFGQSGPFFAAMGALDMPWPGTTSHDVLRSRAGEAWLAVWLDRRGMRKGCQVEAFDGGHKVGALFDDATDARAAHDALLAAGFSRVEMVGSRAIGLRGWDWALERPEMGLPNG